MQQIEVMRVVLGSRYTYRRSGGVFVVTGFPVHPRTLQEQVSYREADHPDAGDAGICSLAAFAMAFAPLPVEPLPESGPVEPMPPRVAGKVTSGGGW